MFQVYSKMEFTHCDLFILPIMRTWFCLVHVGSVWKDRFGESISENTRQLRRSRANRPFRTDAHEDKPPIRPISQASIMARMISQDFNFSLFTT